MIPAKALMVAFCLVAASCAPTPVKAPHPSQTQVSQTQPPQVQASIDACTRQGGLMQKVGRAQTWQCVLQYSDAGKVCTDSRQCQGSCLAQPATEGKAVQGQCAHTSNRFGCRSTMTDGVASPTLCID